MGEGLAASGVIMENLILVLICSDDDFAILVKSIAVAEIEVTLIRTIEAERYMVDNFTVKFIVKCGNYLP